MGKYINHTPDGKELPPKGKADTILATFPGAEEVGVNLNYNMEDLVCVVENPVFDAAAWAYTPLEAMRFDDPFDLRPKRWLIVPDVERYAK